MKRMPQRKAIYMMLVAVMIVFTACGTEEDVDDAGTAIEQSSFSAQRGQELPDNETSNKERLDSEKLDSETQENEIEENKIEQNEIEDKEISDKQTENNETELYVGTYYDFDVNEPMLQISKEDDGTYKIQIGIFRLVQLDDCVGKRGDDGIEFTGTTPNGKEIQGSITLEEDVATVTFLSPEWSEYSSEKEYQYRKTSDLSDR